MTKTLVVGDTQYPLTDSYIQGVFAYRDKENYRDDNPYDGDNDAEIDDNALWESGYSNEEEMATGYSSADEREAHASLVRPCAKLFSVTRAMDILTNRVNDEIEHMKIALRSNDTAVKISATNALWKLEQVSEILKSYGVPKGWTYK